MNEKNVLKRLVEAVVDLEIEHVKALALEAIKKGIPAHKVIENGISQGLEIVGKKFEDKEYFLPELITAGLAAKEGLAVLEPHLKMETTKANCVIVIGTVKGDLHDIGKNIVVSLLKSAGFKVHDLGVNVPAEKFVVAVQETNANVLALSALLTTTMPEMKKVIDMLKTKGLKNKTKVLVGGRPITPEFAKDIGADFYCKNAMDGLKKVKEILIPKNRQISHS